MFLILYCIFLVIVGDFLNYIVIEDLTQGPIRLNNPKVHLVLLDILRNLAISLLLYYSNNVE